MKWRTRCLWLARLYDRLVRKQMKTVQPPPPPSFLSTATSGDRISDTSAVFPQLEPVSDDSEQIAEELEYLRRIEARLERLRNRNAARDMRAADARE